jgi:transcription initiation factor TFIIB
MCMYKMSRQQDVLSIYSKVICPNCNNKDNNNNSYCNIVTDPESGEIICGNCGIVVSDKAQETGPEWRSFGNEESSNNRRIRTGIPTSLARHDMGLSTIIGKEDRDAAGNRIDASVKSKIDRLRMLDFRTQLYNSTDRCLRRAFIELDKLKDKLGLPDSVVEKAAYIYRKAQERGLIRGRTMHAMLAAAIYIACRQIEVGKTLNDIAEGSNVKHKILSQSYRILVTELDIKTPMLDPMKCVAKVANKLNLNERTTRQAMEIMHAASKKEVSAGKDPMGLAAAVLYMSCLNNNNISAPVLGEENKKNKNKNYRSQVFIAEAAGITDVTLRNTINDLKNKILLLN